MAELRGPEDSPLTALMFGNADRDQMEVRESARLNAVDCAEGPRVLGRQSVRALIHEPPVKPPCGRPSRSACAAIVAPEQLVDDHGLTAGRSSYFHTMKRRQSRQRPKSGASPL